MVYLLIAVIICIFTVVIIMQSIYTKIEMNCKQVRKNDKGKVTSPSIVKRKKNVTPPDTTKITSPKVMKRKVEVKEESNMLSIPRKILNTVTSAIKRPVTTSKPAYGKSEELCRSIAEQLFGKKFPKVRPDFLRSPLSNRNLEIDCYCEELGIGIEYNGIQHYKYPNIFHKSRDEFMRLVANDKFKRETCKINGILLITIPYTLPKSQIRSYILERVKEMDTHIDLRNNY